MKEAVIIFLLYVLVIILDSKIKNVGGLLGQPRETVMTTFWARPLILMLQYNLN